MEGIESEGKTVAEAVDSALRRLGLRRDQVEVQILQEATAGFWGMGAKPARVRLQEKRWGEGGPQPSPVPRPQAQPRQPTQRREQKFEPDLETAREAAPAHRRQPRPEPEKARAPEPEKRRAAAVAEAPASAIDSGKACAETSAILQKLFSLMALAPEKLQVTWDGVQERVRCSIEGADAERLVGGDGHTLEALQFLSTLMVSRKIGSPVAVQVDALGYWDKREKDILAHAERGIVQVRATGKAVRLPPMDAPMRRLIHRNLAGHPDVETASEGEGSWRKIVIRPRKR